MIKQIKDYRFRLGGSKNKGSDQGKDTIFRLKPSKYSPKDKDELKNLMEILIKERGNDGRFNDIDTSKVTDMSDLFKDNSDFNGDISDWNVGKVTDMSSMFENASSFDRDLNNWVTEQANTSKMFKGATKMRKQLPDWY